MRRKGVDLIMWMANSATGIARSLLLSITLVKNLEQRKYPPSLARKQVECSHFGMT